MDHPSHTSGDSGREILPVALGSVLRALVRVRKILAVASGFKLRASEVFALCSEPEHTHLDSHIFSFDCYNLQI
jgi:hypothetical protein